jgi:hypothetical protein
VGPVPTHYRLAIRPDITLRVQDSMVPPHVLGAVLMACNMTRPPTDAGGSDQEMDGLSAASGMIVLLIPTLIF